MMCKKDSNHRKHGNKDNSLATAYKNMHRFTGILAACFIITACDNADVPVLPDEANDRVSITNNLDVLNTRVSYSNENVVIENNSPAALRRPSIMNPASAVSIRLITQVKPPTVDGQVVQATSVSLARGSAVISYNMRGAPRLGAVDWISRFTIFRPRLTSGITFVDSDINAVHTDGTYVYTAVATNAVDYPFPAVVVTNTVSVYKDLMFISNGEAGVYVARSTGNFSENNCATQNITMLGKLRFDDLQSANHVTCS